MDACMHEWVMFAPIQLNHPDFRSKRENLETDIHKEKTLYEYEVSNLQAQEGGQDQLHSLQLSEVINLTDTSKLNFQLPEL